MSIRDETKRYGEEQGRSDVALSMCSGYERANANDDVESKEEI
jgi:hypothetical protein